MLLYRIALDVRAINMHTFFIDKINIYYCELSICILLDVMK